MKLAILTSALAAAVFAAAPVPASASVVSAGMSVTDGQARGHLVLADHDRRGYRDYRDRRDRRWHRGRHGRHGRCQSWRFVHRKLHRRFEYVRLQRTIRNRRGDRIFIAHARNYRGRPFRIRYNSCRGQVMKVVPLHHRRYRRY